jgi:hypothetical protein
MQLPRALFSSTTETGDFRFDGNLVDRLAAAGHNAETIGERADGGVAGGNVRM